MDDFEPVDFDEEGKPTLYRWNSEKFRASLSPAARRNWDRRIKANHFIYSMYRNIPWMDWPILKLVYMFWHGMFEDGIKSTCAPRWGLVTFHFLNDGMKPTLWHTWRQLTGHREDKYSGIYPSGAPHSRKEAEEWENKWEQERKSKEILDENIFQ
jgi:hypothetical protein